MLTLENLSFDVNDEKGEIGIIKDIASVGDGKFVVITGPNGGGKSTTAKLIMGIERPTGGRILFDGQDITNMSITDRANSQGSALHFSSQSVSKAWRSLIFCVWRPEGS